MASDVSVPIFCSSIFHWTRNQINKNIAHFFAYSKIKIIYLMITAFHIASNINIYTNNRTEFINVNIVDIK